MTTLADVQIVRGFPATLAATLWGWFNAPRRMNFDDYGPKNFAQFAPLLAKRIDKQHTWLVTKGEEKIGYLGFLRINSMSGQFHGMVIDPMYRRMGIGSAAMKLAIAELQTEGYTKMLSMPHGDNDHIRRLLSSNGFQQEGYLWQATKRDGELIDLRLMSWTKEGG